MKKGALNLSINAIVVLILAITILGLGLGFIRNQFQTATDQFDRVNEETETEMINEMISSNDLVTLKQKEFEVEAGTPYEFFFGIRNTDDQDRVYFIQFICDQGYNTGNCRNATEGKEDYYDGDNVANHWSWFQTYNMMEIPAGEGEAMYAKLLAEDPDTFRGKMLVWKCTEPSIDDCTDVQFNTTGGIPSSPDVTNLGSETFTMIVK